MVWKCLSDEAKHLGCERVQALNQFFDVVGQENHGRCFAVLLVCENVARLLTLRALPGMQLSPAPPVEVFTLKERPAP
jgi:hypothetical protein